MGCSSSRPENSPAIKNKFNELDEQVKEIAKLQRDLTLIQDDIKYFTEELNNVRSLATSGMTPEQSNALQQLATKSAEVDQLKIEVAALNNELKRVTNGNAGIQIADAAPPASNPSNAATGTVIPKTTPGSVNPGTPEVRTPMTSSPAPKITSQKTSNPKKPLRKNGFFVRVQSGDTLASLAKANGISVGDLAKANNLSESARPQPGARLWVP